MRGPHLLTGLTACVLVGSAVTSDSDDVSLLERGGVSSRTSCALSYSSAMSSLLFSFKTFNSAEPKSFEDNF
jgi:hypothetical protein